MDSIGHGRDASHEGQGRLKLCLICAIRLEAVRVELECSECNRQQMTESLSKARILEKGATNAKTHKARLKKRKRSPEPPPVVRDDPRRQIELRLSSWSGE
jgi:hypothetical protein